MPPSDHQRRGQRRDARRDVNDGAAGEIERAHLMNPSVDAPYPMRQRIVNQSRPQEAEDQEAAKDIRSANAPVINAGVITANMHWKIMYA